MTRRYPTEKEVGLAVRLRDFVEEMVDKGEKGFDHFTKSGYEFGDYVEAVEGTDSFTEVKNKVTRLATYYGKRAK